MATPLTRKCGETHAAVHSKFRQSNIGAQIQHHTWDTTAGVSFSQTNRDDYSNPTNIGAGKNKTKAALESKRFVAKTSHHIDFLVDSEATRTYHMKPQRRPACEIAMEGGSKFKTAKKKSIQISRELLIEEKRRLSALAPLESVDCSTVKRNLPGYTGHEPQSPKNARGPYLPHTMSTAGYANAVGLGLS